MLRELEQMLVEACGAEPPSTLEALVELADGIVAALRRTYSLGDDPGYAIAVEAFREEVSRATPAVVEAAAPETVLSVPLTEPENEVIRVAVNASRLGAAVLRVAFKEDGATQERIDKLVALAVAVLHRVFQASSQTRDLRYEVVLDHAAQHVRALAATAAPQDRN